MNGSRWTTIATTVVIVLGLALLVAWLRASAPAPTADVTIDGLPPADEHVTCEQLEGSRVGPGGSQVTGVVTSTAVLTCPFGFDGLRVRYLGEVVGDVLARDGGSWVLMNDDSYGLGDGPLTAGGTPRGTNSGLSVWLPDPLDELADEPGRPGRRGDVLEVTGTVHRADPRDGGGLTIRVTEVAVRAEAATIDEPVHWRQVTAAVLLGALALAVLWRERQRRNQ